MRDFWVGRSCRTNGGKISRHTSTLRIVDPPERIWVCVVEADQRCEDESAYAPFMLRECGCTV